MATYCKTHDLENCWYMHSPEELARNARYLAEYGRYAADAQYRNDAHWRQIDASIAIDGGHELNRWRWRAPVSPWQRVNDHTAAVRAYDARIAAQVARDNQEAFA